MHGLTLRRSFLLSGGALVALGSGLAAPQLAAQQGGRLMSFDVSQRLEGKSNPSLSPDGSDASVVATTELGYSISSSTPTSSLALSLDGRLIEDFADDEQPTFEGPDAELSYGRTGANARLNASLSYSERDIRYTSPLDLSEAEEGGELPDDLPSDLADLEGEGTRKRLNLSARAEYGLRDRFGLALSVQARDLSYEDVTTPELQDTRAYSSELEARFDVRPAFRVTTSLGYKLVEEEGVSEETIGLGAGVVIDRPTRTYGGGLALDQVEGELRGGVTAGVEGELPRGGRYDVAIGVTRTLEETYVFTANGSYTAPLTPLSQLEVSLDRTVEDNIDEGEVVSTTFDANYLRELTPLTQLSVGAELVREEDTGGDRASTDARISAGLNRQLTRDWSAFVGVSEEISDDEDGTATSEGVFLEIGRSFDTTF